MLEHLLADDPDDVLALTMLGLHWTGDAANSSWPRPLLRRAVEQAPDEASTRMALAELLLRSKRAALALAELDAINGDGGAERADPVAPRRMPVARSAGWRRNWRSSSRSPLAAGRAMSAMRCAPAMRCARLGGKTRRQPSIAQSLGRYPGEGTSWWSLANLKTIRFDDADIADDGAGAGAARDAGAEPHPAQFRARQGA